MPPTRDDRFRHEAMFYRGEADLVARLVPFLREGAERADAMLVALPKRKVDALRDALGVDAEAVTFSDMDAVSMNPARIIPAWRWFVDAHAASGRSMRGVGEPINATRAGAELTECHRHESLLNVAFPEQPPFRLLCPYDVDALAPAVVDEAHRTHPIVYGDASVASSHYAPVDLHEPFAAPFAEPATVSDDLDFGAGPLRVLRRFVATLAVDAGLDGRVFDLVLAVNEVATNSIQHGGGDGRLRVWTDDGTFVCEVADRGVIDAPLVGRQWPDSERESGRGLWMANQVCDLVQVHSTRNGTAVRLHMRCPA